MGIKSIGQMMLITMGVMFCLNQVSGMPGMGQVRTIVKGQAVTLAA